MALKFNNCHNKVRQTVGLIEFQDFFGRTVWMNPEPILRARCAIAWPPLAALILGLAVPSRAAGNEPDALPSEVHVRQILDARCVKCHGAGKLEGGLDLRRDLTMLKGGDSGPAVVPGKPDESLLVQRIESGEMPPGKKGPLGKEDQALIRRWVRERGIRSSSRGDSPSPTAADRPATITEDDRRFWAFQAPKRPMVPQVESALAVRTPVDAFVLERLEARGLAFNSEAPRQVLLRRLCFDLLGLPPTLAQQEEFLRDRRADAYEFLVDRLLASPAYGERWGRHWLDIAGYADSDGSLAADRVRPEAWRYRDYVIQAFNRDMPFDGFLTEQLAGDELCVWRGAETLTAEVVRQLTATGFLRTASDATYPGYTEPNEIHQVLSDTMQIVGSTFLGITLQCARCHAHKFDPISQHDYYAFQSIFLPALDPARWQPSEVRGIPLATERELARLKAENQQVAELAKPIEAKLAALKDKKESTALKAQLASVLARKKPDAVLIRGLTDLPGTPPQGRILKRGDYARPGAAVDPAVPAVLAGEGYRLMLPSGIQTTGRRLALARWLTAPDHPLTARVQVNRMWAHHFGRGLVPTTANFGRSGAPPSHPELLDWLATEFIRSGWSIKAMHRLMVTSTVYRQSSQADSRKQKADPDNMLLGSWRPSRMEGEVLRDSILAVAGKLNQTRFGPPVPVSAKADASVEIADDVQGHRRSIYLMVRRSQNVTFLDLFDTPTMAVNCPERVVSTVPLQALALLNSSFAERSAAALADRIRKNADDPQARLAYAYRLLFAREPTSREIALVGQFQHSLVGPASPDETTAQKVRRGPADLEAWVQTALVLLNSNEFLYVN
jgi:mono/diheme cytochrome c family protein